MASADRTSNWSGKINRPFWDATTHIGCLSGPLGIRQTAQLNPGNNTRPKQPGNETADQQERGATSLEALPDRPVSASLSTKRVGRECPNTSHSHYTVALDPTCLRWQVERCLIRCSITVLALCKLVRRSSAPPNNLLHYQLCLRVRVNRSHSRDEPRDILMRSCEHQRQQQKAVYSKKNETGRTWPQEDTPRC